MRSGIGGCVPKTLAMKPGLFGSAIHMCAMLEFCRATGRPYCPSFASALSSSGGFLVIIALDASARYSRWREIAAWITAATIGEMMSAASPITSRREPDGAPA